MGLFTAIGTGLGLTGLAATAAGVGTVAAVVGGAYAVGTMSQPKAATEARKQAQMPTAPVKPVQADAAKLAQQRITDKKRAAARSKSVKTSPLGVKDEAQVARKTLLGQ